MARNQNRRLTPATLRDDQRMLDVVKNLSPAYAPSDARYNVADGATRLAAMTGAQADEVIARGQAAAARDIANANEWAFHNFILGVKPQVIAQYGADSDQVQAIGLKKKSERKPPGHRLLPKTPA
jgi:hypothetical protein